MWWSMQDEQLVDGLDELVQMGLHVWIGVLADGWVGWA